MRPGVFWGILGYPWVSWGVLGCPGVIRPTLLITNNASLIEKYNPFLLHKHYLIDLKQKILKQSM